MTALPSPTASVFGPGVVVAGKYRITNLLGEGGVGCVYRAVHEELETDVALKVLRPEMATRTDLVQRFQREARASVRLRSEHIARVYDVGTHEGRPYFVMEHLVGSDLARLSQGSQLDLAMLAELFIQACEGLAVAHGQGIVHRDVKPENLFVVKDESGWQTLKILDFGISKIALTGKVSDVDIAMMRTEVMMGTPHYISPEQIRSTRDVDHRTDIWSLGIAIFEVASGGTMPFREERDITALIAEILERPHRKLREVAPSVPDELEVIVDRCLEKDPDKRYQSAAELAAALLPLAPKRARASVERATAAARAAGMGADVTLSTVPPNSDGAKSHPSLPRPPKNPSVPGALSATVPSGPSTLPAPREQRRLAPVVTVAALVVVAAVAAAGYFLRGRGAPKTAELAQPTATVQPSVERSAAARAPEPPPLATTAAATPVASAPPEAPAVPTQSSPSTRSPVVPRAQAQPPPSPKPSASANASPLEIRHER